MRKVELHRIYRHFKGDHYLVEDVATDSETGEPVVIYRKLYGDGGLWVRPLSMFLEPVDRTKYPHCRKIRRTRRNLCRAQTYIYTLQICLAKHP